ncbi:hypothetical protein HN51_051870 [Arachis hypogaea]|uniref:AT-hook motif nuclear-localized protein n=1 Tax=Arachis hypogaea TaxID=3818 RepID=A0A445CD52_ARAHY|nr:AT-hook motif nuclear-localized protein 10 [Arachis ipaensis]XP_025665471.1 AT-hook motif nuclear-localized protein 10 [Arachis hypogaea]QHN93087.1 AT-hook motif nuclear-localized protein [Arachis hypogaea]QHN93088.1 AT-hook motif nuclear-localized protein [Arachis hypogaea]RYR48858.1 hypothetical protein Ahy_A07g034941 isoform A [Arachis hypogaea]RYR48859.1 hypothetical protein Ahy_A07g034941 isoform B [Arachis hypogaea]
MSGSEMGSREGFTVGLHSHNNMRLDFSDGPALYSNSNNNPLAPPSASPTYHPSTAVTAAPININGSAVGGIESVAALPQGGHIGSSSEPKKKRGRPRKYVPDGGGVGLGLNPDSSAPGMTVNHSQNQNPNLNSSLNQNQSGGGAMSPGIASATPNSNSGKKRGRPRGSLNKHPHLKGLGLAKLTFTPHVLTVKSGEDLGVKVTSISMDGPRNICILTANGTISNVTLSQPSIPGGTVTYEGRFEILALCGSFLLSENGQFQRTGSLSLTLSGPDGRVMGGAIAGVCVAASPIQIVFASFLVDGGYKKMKSSNQNQNQNQNQMGTLASSPNVLPAGQSSSPSHGTLSESSGGAGSPLNLSTDVCNNNNTPQGISGMPWK